MAGEDCDKLVATLKNTPKKDPPKPNELEALNNAINDIFGGKGTPRIDPKTGKQKVFGGMLENGQKVDKWKGGLEWEVIPGNNRLRLVTKDLGDGRIMVGFGYPHWARIFDVVIK